MRAVDTNVVVRYLLGDDPAQTARARSIIGHGPVFISTTVLLEVEWVLRSTYAMPAARTVAILRALAGIAGTNLENPPLTAKALDWFENGMDFADAIHLAAAADCEAFLTFDRRLARSRPMPPSIPVTLV